MSAQQYTQFLQENPPERGGAELQMVRSVGEDLVKAVETYYRANGLADQLSEFDWEFNLVDDPNVNAFCMPGGKVVIYSGILPICKDRDGLAVVMGHEIAHALAHHGNERMSQQLGVNGALTVLDAALTVRAGAAATAAEQQKRQQASQLIMTAAGAGAQVGVLLPFSRKHESEADRIGLYLMAIAGYNVDAAAPFWQRMQAGAGATPPEFLSTHPSPDTRSQNLRKWAPEARALAKNY
jgi:predicted Zn-dependent protease